MFFQEYTDQFLDNESCFGEYNEERYENDPLLIRLNNGVYKVYPDYNWLEPMIDDDSGRVIDNVADCVARELDEAAIAINGKLWFDGKNWNLSGHFYRDDEPIMWIAEREVMDEGFKEQCRELHLELVAV